MDLGQATSPAAAPVETIRSSFIPQPITHSSRAAFIHDRRGARLTGGTVGRAAAAIAVAVAIVAYLTGRPIRTSLALTGDLSFRSERREGGRQAGRGKGADSWASVVAAWCDDSGRVLRIGHLRGKVQGAKHYRLRHVICPQDSLDDYLKEEEEKRRADGQQGDVLRTAAGAGDTRALLEVKLAFEWWWWW